MPGRTVKLLFAVSVAVAFTSLFAGQAASQPVAGCSGQALAQPFLPWLDPAQYVLAPDGGLEQGGAAWTLAGGARVVAGNEPWRVGNPADSRSLLLPAGSSATTGWMCISLLHPTLRLFTANGGSLLSTLEAEVLWRDGSALRAAPIAVILSGNAWQPTLPMPILVNALNLPLLTDGTLSVAFRFTPRGPAGPWRIDDTYVDPYQGR